MCRCEKHSASVPSTSRGSSACRQLSPQSKRMRCRPWRPVMRTKTALSAPGAPSTSYSMDILAPPPRTVAHRASRVRWRAPEGADICSLSRLDLRYSASMHHHAQAPAESAGAAGPPPHAPRSRSLLRSRDFLLLWSGQIVSSFGTSVSQLAMPLLVLALTRSPAQAGFVGALQLAPYLALALPAGALVD